MQVRRGGRNGPRSRPTLSSSRTGGFGGKIQIDGTSRRSNCVKAAHCKKVRPHRTRTACRMARNCDRNASTPLRKIVPNSTQNTKIITSQCTNSPTSPPPQPQEPKKNPIRIYPPPCPHHCPNPDIRLDRTSDKSGGQGYLHNPSPLTSTSKYPRMTRAKTARADLPPPSIQVSGTENGADERGCLRDSLRRDAMGARPPVGVLM